MDKREERLSSANINWYPGHMEKAKRQMQEQLKMVDIIIELRDARMPISSANPVLAELGKDKPRLIVLTKKDVADDELTKKWLEVLNEKLCINADRPEGIKYSAKHEL